VVVAVAVVVTVAIVLLLVVGAASFGGGGGGGGFATLIKGNEIVSCNDVRSNIVNLIKNICSANG